MRRTWRAWGRAAVGRALVAGAVATSACARVRPRAEPLEPEDGVAETSAPEHGAPAPPPSDRARARELYRVAEERFSADAPGEAVELVDHALRALPSEIAHEKTRHDLTMRLTHMELVAFEAEDDIAWMLDARTRLLARAARIDLLQEALAPDAVEAMRRDVFTQLRLVEERIDPLLRDQGESGDDEALTPEVEPPPTPAASSRSSRRRTGPESPASPGLPEETRVVHVETSRLASLDDSKVDERLRSRFSDPGPSLTGPGFALVHGPRPLVRLRAARGEDGRRSIRLAAGARRWLEENRDTLLACYDEAFSRDPIPGLAVVLSMDLDGHGAIERAAVDRGRLVDAAGNRCLVETAAGTKLATGEVAEPALEVELVFFYEAAVMINEATGETVPAWSLSSQPIIQQLTTPRSAPRAPGDP